jgi:hypothetical protein
LGKYGGLQTLLIQFRAQDHLRVQQLTPKAVFQIEARRYSTDARVYGASVAVFRKLAQ